MGSILISATLFLAACDKAIEKNRSDDQNENDQNEPVSGTTSSIFLSNKSISKMVYLHLLSTFKPKIKNQIEIVIAEDEIEYDTLHWDDDIINCYFPPMPDDSIYYEM